MDTSARRRSGWVALCLTLIARMLLGILASLLLWAVAPAALGWHPTVVMTGSMLPRLVPGDVVLSRPVPTEQLQLGQTLLYADPDRPGRLRMHRWVDVAAGGLLVTKGDANPERDSTPIERSAVAGVASLRIPFVARPVVWANEGRTAPLLLTGLALLATVVAAGWFRAVDEDSGEEADDETDEGDDAGEAPAGDGESARDDEPAPRPGWPRRVAQSGAALLVVVGLATTYAATAHAATAGFASPGATATGGWTGATYFSCAAATRAAGATLSWPLSESAGPTAASAVPNGPTGTYSGGVAYRTPGPCAADGTTGVTLNGSSGAVATSTAINGPAELTLQIWFRTNSTRGGTLMSVTSTFLFLFDSTSAAIGMNPNGTVVFGAAANSGGQRATSAAAYNDNAWHLTTGVIGAGGATLYVDGAAVASNPALTSAGSVSGTPRVGYGVAASLQTGATNYFQGSVAFASLYGSALGAAVVKAQYDVATV